MAVVRGGGQALQHLVELAPAGDRLELVGVQGVQRDVHPLHAEAGQLVREAAELAAVGGEGELLQRAAVEMAREGVEQLHDVAAHQRLAACEARSEEHTSELQSLMRISYAVYCMQKKIAINANSNTP